jgi:hypothetical protein
MKRRGSRSTTQVEYGLTGRIDAGKSEYLRMDIEAKQPGRLFAALKGEAKLNLMVNIVSKTSHYDINFPTRI